MPAPEVTPDAVRSWYNGLQPDQQERIKQRAKESGKDLDTQATELYRHGVGSGLLKPPPARREAPQHTGSIGPTGDASVAEIMQAAHDTLERFRKEDPETAAILDRFASDFSRLVQERQSPQWAAQPPITGDRARDMASAIRWGAKQVGVSPEDLATVISFESRFSTSIRGGKNNNHIGLIQFGIPEQKQYGADQKQNAMEQMQAVVRYLQHRGFKPGMRLLDLYSTINGGRPGVYNRSDATAGGTWGTIKDKVLYQMEGHKLKARALLGAHPE